MLNESSFIKLTIWGFSDPGYKNLIGPPYIALVNPENYTQRYSVNYTSIMALGTNNPSSKYVNTEAEAMSFKFLFDVTGAIIGLNPSAAVIPISEQINTFLNLAYTYVGNQHQPNFLKLVWGDTIFKGNMESVNIENKLFDPTGRVLRAILNCKFRSSGTESVLDAISQPSSPDLTHQRVINQGDTLPLLCYKIYGSSQYYYQVAQVNGLTSFRNLKVGSSLYFPPLTKQ